MIWRKSRARNTKWSRVAELLRSLSDELQRQAVIEKTHEADIVLAKPPTLPAQILAEVDVGQRVRVYATLTNDG